MLETTLRVSVSGKKIEKKVKEYLDASNVARPLNLEYLFHHEVNKTPATVHQMLLVSESVLAKTWNTPEEDIAWDHL